MRESFINSPDDMRWLRDVHIPTLSPEYHSAIIRGNDDCPEEVWVFATRDPLISESPMVYRADADGVLRA